VGRVWLGVKLLRYVISIVAALSVGDPFVHEEGLLAETEADQGVDEELSKARLPKSKKLNVHAEKPVLNHKM